MQQTTQKVLNFALIFALALLTAYFTLENTASTTINIVPGVASSLPIAALVIISSGLGACGAWFFAFWSDRQKGNEIKKLEEAKNKELQETRNRMQELEIAFNNLKAKQNNIASVRNLSGEKSSDEQEKEVA